MELGIQGRSALVTGASMGIGKGIASALVREVRCSKPRILRAIGASDCTSPGGAFTAVGRSRAVYASFRCQRRD